MDWNLIFSLLGSAIGCVSGILASQKLTGYRISRLEEQVAKHNNLVERMAVAEIEIRNFYKLAESLNRTGETNSESKNTIYN